MISFRDGILSVRKSSELHKSSTLRFMYEICLYLGIVFYYFMNSSRLHYIGVIFLAASAAVILLEKLKYSRINNIIIAGWFLAFIILCELSALWAYSPYISAFKYLKMLLLILAISFGVAQYADTRKDIDRILDVYLFSTLTITLMQFIGTPSERWFIGYFGGYIGANNSNNFGYIVLFACIIAFYKAYNQKKRLWYFAALLFLISCLLSSSRKASGASVFGIMCIILFSFNRRYHILHFFIALLAAMFAFELCMTNPQLYSAIGERIINLLTFVNNGSSPQEFGSLQLREFYIDFAHTLFRRHPLVGNGFVSFHTLLYNETDVGFGYAHNNYWELLADLGIIGILVYYWFYAYMAVKLGVRFFKKSADSLHMLAAVMFICEIILEWGIVVLYIPYCQIIIALIYICACSNRTNKRQFYYSEQKNGGQ